MPGPLFTAAAVATCPHGGPVLTVSSNARVTVMAMPVVTIADMSTVPGCPLKTLVPPQPPCMKVQWTPSARVKVMGLPAAIAVPPGMCLGSAAPGPAIIITVQPRVTGM
jgi:hypothetical protein